MWSQEDDLRKPLLDPSSGLPYDYQQKRGGSGKYSKEDDSTTGKARPTSRSCNDILFGILFLLVVIGMAVISGIAYSRGQPGQLVPSNTFINGHNSTVIVDGLQDAVAQMRQNKDVLIYSVLVAFTVAALWMELLKRFTRFFIYLTMCLGVALVIIVGIFFMFLGHKESSEATMIVGGCTIILGLLLVGVVVYLRRSIDLTCAMFTETCRGVQRSPSVFVTGIVVILFFIGFLAYWTSSFVYLFSIPGHNIHWSGSSSDSNELPHFDDKIRNLMFYMVFAFLWVTAYISAVFQSVVAGAVSHWYFARGSANSEVGSSNAFVSLGRAMTTSLGSLALGSLVIAFIEFFAFMLRLAKKSNAENKLAVMLLSCIQCILGCVEGIVRWVNKFGYIYVAMHGYSFCTATKACFDLIQRNMFTAVIMDFIGSFVLLLGKIMVTAGTALFASVVLYCTDRSIKANVITIGLAALFAFCISNIFTHIIGIGTDTIFVCYLEDVENNGTANLLISPDLHELLQAKCDEHKKKDQESN
ncbi:hypothetical protein SAMD00019534_086140 [Acytostelium subglobosum LB1]|uniref:hypothetical protein n=1 Tax=Acytostelium subglobosum LB1 TaxID=1410327 RepID=UPI000644C4C6|nr:hypothetical protein SAMD00019534_086140 [Acytostelium subglobosum LB1]GAM25439.1 hypothetical protein SAMD00019534_086140 [Acytostelium subglobosum LB1]|eukprot:XP_012751425.1 hypothetical protein SAMD00019534_086140 [Acytostelium subglobosum LB1]